jgi:hypothetical protein
MKTLTLDPLVFSVDLTMQCGVALAFLVAIVIAQIVKGF